MTDRRPDLGVRLRSLALPAWRTAAYLSPGATRRRRERFAPSAIPLPRRSAAVAAHVATDEVTLAVFRLVREPPSEDAWRRIDREIDEALDLYERRGWLDDPAAYLGAPPPLDGAPSGAGRSGTLTFDSGWAPHPGEPGRERWLGYDPNQVAHARVLRHDDGPRPWVVCVHGTGMGRPGIDARVLRVRRLHHDLGCNVVLPVLPLHGARRPPRSSGAQFPTVDVLDNVHGLAQAAWDVRRLLSWVRRQEPTAVAITGTSLGGYVASLVAGLESTLDCVVALVPAADFPKIFRRQTPREVRRTEGFRILGERTDRLHRVVSPLLLAPATPRSRLFLAGGTADRLLDPVDQVAALWQHWGRPEVHWFEGGHVGHLVRRDLIRFVEDALERTGVTVRRVADPAP